MRLPNDQALRSLGEVPGLLEVRDAIEREFTLQDPSFMTNERVFYGCFRIVGTNQYFDQPQLYSSSARQDRLVELTKPLVQFLETVYPNAVPVLIQCATLPPKLELKWHIDTYLYQSVSHKVHFPLRTNLRARYEAKQNGNVISKHFPVGTAIEINNILLHRAVNHGSTARTHLIIDMMDRAELDRFLEQGVNFHHTQHEENKALERLLTT